MLHSSVVVLWISNIIYEYFVEIANIKFKSSDAKTSFVGKYIFWESGNLKYNINLDKI